MKPSDQLLYKLLSHIDDKEKFKQYILVFSENKIASFYETTIDCNFEENKVMQHYKKNTYKNYKAELKPLVIDYLSAIMLKSHIPKELRRTLDIYDLFTILNIPLFKELDTEIQAAIKKTDNNEEYLTRRMILFALKLQNDHRLHINSYNKILNTCELYEKVSQRNLYNISMYKLQMKVAILFTTKSSIRTKKDADKISILEKELEKIYKNEPLKNIQLIYYLQSMVCVKLMQGIYREAYNLQIQLLKEVDNFDFSNDKLKKYQVGEQVTNAFLYGLKTEQKIDVEYLSSIANKYLKNSEDIVLISLVQTFKYLNKVYKKELKVEDVDDFLYFTRDNEASLFSQNTYNLIVCAYASFGEWEKAVDILSEVLGNYPSFKVLKDGQEMAILLRSVVYYELFKLNPSNFDSFQSFVSFAYNKFRKDKEEYLAEIVILKQLLKVKSISTKEEIKEIFKQMKIKLEDSLDEYSSIYWKNYCFSFDFNKWISTNTK